MVGLGPSVPLFGSGSQLQLLKVGPNVCLTGSVLQSLMLYYSLTLIYNLLTSVSLSWIRG